MKLTALRLYIWLMSLLLLVIGIVSWKLAALMTPFVVFYSMLKKPWTARPEPKEQKVNRNHRLPLSRVRIPRMRIK